MVKKGFDGWSVLTPLRSKIQGVSTLSGQSNLLISPTQNWFIFDSLGSNSPQDKTNLYGGIGFYENSIYYL